MEQQKPEERAGQQPRQPYRAPELRRLGSVTDITRATGSGNFLVFQEDSNLPDWMRPKP